MLAFVLRRLIQAVVVMLTVAFIAFMLFQYVGDPVTNLLGQDATAEQRDNCVLIWGSTRHSPCNLLALSRTRFRVSSA